MFMMLAQTAGKAQEMADNLVYKEPTSMPSFNFEFLDQFEAWAKNIVHTSCPSQDEVIGGLQVMGMPTAIVLCVLGAAFLILGWRAFQLLCIVNLAILGTMAGGVGAIQLGWSNWWLGMLVGGLALLALGLPLLRAYVVICTALVGVAIGYIGFYYGVHATGQADLASRAWIGSIVGAALLTGVLFIAFRIAIMLMTAIQGGILIVTGGLGIGLQAPQVSATIRNYLTDWPLSPLVVIFAIALLGFVLQLAWAFRRSSSDDDNNNGDTAPDPTRPQFSQPY